MKQNQAHWGMNSYFGMMIICREKAIWEK